MRAKKGLIIAALLIIVVIISGCTSETGSKPVNGKYNTIIQTVGSDSIWKTDICPQCGTPDAEVQKQTDKLVSNKCLKCGYVFYTLPNL